MKYIYYSLLSILTLGFLSCEKVNVDLIPEANASAAFVFAAPFTPPIAPATLPSYDIVVDGLVANGNRRLSYPLVSDGGGSGNGRAYMPFLEGTRSIKISRDSGKANSVLDLNLAFEKNKPYTIVIYDTLGASSNLRSVRLNDDLTVPAAGRVHVRFIHASPRGATWDATFLRTSASPNDSVTLTNRSYLGLTPNIANLSSFTSLPSGTYTLILKASGTQNVVGTFSLGTNLATSTRIFTITSAGTAQNQPLNTILLRHY